MEEITFYGKNAEEITEKNLNLMKIIEFPPFWRFYLPSKNQKRLSSRSNCNLFHHLTISIEMSKSRNLMN